MTIKSLVTFGLFVLNLAAPSLASAEKFIPAANRLDMVHDNVMGILYITDGAQILRYDTTNLAFTTPISIPGASLRGIDLSPDRSTLVVADGITVGSENRVRVVDTNTLASREIRFDLQSNESGTYVPAFTSNQEFLITSTYAGSGWIPLRKVDLATDTATTLQSVRQSTMLTPSADLSTVAWAEANTSAGTFGRYRVADGDLDESGTGWFAFEIGVNRDGTQFAVPSYGGTYIYDGDFNLIDRIGIYADESPIGVAYSPVDDLVYFAWYDRGYTHPSIDAYDTNTLTKVKTIDSQQRFDSTGNGAFKEGRLEISRDGRYLFATVDGGVQMYLVPEPSSWMLIGSAVLLLFVRRLSNHAVSR